MTKSPLIDEGSTRGAMERIRQLGPDCSVVLKGGNRVQVCGPEERVSRWSIWAQKFNYYVVVSGRRIKATRKETMPSRDPRFDLDLTIDMDVSVTNAGDFVRDYGPDASVIDPFYLTLRGNLREKVRN